MIEKNTYFHVGDKVVRNYQSDNSCAVGTITKITEKRKDVVVDFGSYIERYDLNGWQKTGDVWFMSRIYLLTPEIEKEMEETKIIKRCCNEFAKTNITYEQAVKILKILGDE